MTLFSSYINNHISQLYEKFEETTSVKDISLSYYRILFGLLLLLYFLHSWTCLGVIPPAFFYPNILILSNLSNGYLPGFIYKIADITGIVLGVMITLGIRARIALIFMEIPIIEPK